MYMGDLGVIPPKINGTPAASAAALNTAIATGQLIQSGTDNHVMTANQLGYAPGLETLGFMWTADGCPASSFFGPMSLDEAKTLVFWSGLLQSKGFTTCLPQAQAMVAATGILSSPVQTGPAAPPPGTVATPSGPVFNTGPAIGIPVWTPAPGGPVEIPPLPGAPGASGGDGIGGLPLSTIAIGAIAVLFLFGRGR
jgi:hypothetical protein